MQQYQGSAEYQGTLGDERARQQASEEEEIRRIKAARRTAEAQDFNAATSYEIRTASRVAAELIAAGRNARIPLGSTVLEELAAIHQWAVRFSQQAGLVQHDDQLLVIAPDGTSRQIRTPDQLLAVIVLTHARDFQCPFVKFAVDKEGVRHGTDGEPRRAALRAYLASPRWPGVKAWVLPGRDNGESARQRALRLLNEAMDAREKWKVAADKLASQLGVDSRQAEQLVVEAGFRVRRPTTASGRPQLDSRTRRVLWQIER